MMQRIMVVVVIVIVVVLLLLFENAQQFLLFVQNINKPPDSGHCPIGRHWRLVCWLMTIFIIIMSGRRQQQVAIRGSIIIRHAGSIK